MALTTGTGAAGEDLVAARLEAEGWRIVARNRRVLGVELDLVARRGRDVLVVEVKASRRSSRPEVGLGPAQRRRLLRAAAALAAPGERLAVLLAAVRLEGSAGSELAWYRVTPNGPS